MVDLLNLVERVKDVVRNAAKLTQVSDFAIKEKEGESYNLVTSVDIAVQNYLQKELPAILPGSGFYGEENDQRDTSKELCWIVDPIDGTANFSRNLHLSGISVALRDGQDLVLGVVMNPDLGDMFWATKGGGAYLNGARLSVSNKDFEHSLICTALCLYRKRYTDLCIEAMRDFHNQCADVRRLGVASLELCYLAAGKVDGYFELRLFPWDFAAAAVIIREAGGVVGTVKWDGNDFKMSENLVLDAPSPVISANCCDNYHKIGQIVTKNMESFDLSEYNY